MTPNHERRDPREPYIPEPPCIAYDIGQSGWPTVLVVEELADTVQEYVERAADDSDHPFSFPSNALSGAEATDSVYRCVYDPGSPLKDPQNAYPVPESRLAQLDLSAYDALDGDSHGAMRHPREAVVEDVLVELVKQFPEFTVVEDEAATLFDAISMALSERVADDVFELAEVEMMEEDPTSAPDPEGERPEDGDESDDDGDLGDFDPDE